MNWQKELPQKEGDYLWVIMWSCNCCIHKNGIVTVHEIIDLEYQKPSFQYQNKEGILMGFFGDPEDIPPLEDGCIAVNGWLELTTLPKSKTVNNTIY